MGNTSINISIWHNAHLSNFLLNMIRERAILCNVALQPNDIAHRRKSLGLTQLAAAQLAGVSQRTWNRFETDPLAVANARNSTLAAIARALQWEDSDELGKLVANHRENVRNPASSGEIEPSVARVQLGQWLRGKRKAGNLSKKELASMAGLQLFDIEGAERGTRRFTEGQFETIAESLALNTDDFKEGLALWRGSRVLIYDFIAMAQADDFEKYFRDLYETEVAARQVAWNCPQILPGFLQLPEYFAQILERTTALSSEQISRLSVWAEKRASVTIFGSAEIRAIVHPNALNSIIDNDILHRQVNHLIWLNELDRVEIRVLRADARPTRGLLGSWGIYDQEIVHAHNLNGAQTNRHSHVVDFFSNVFEMAWKDPSLFETGIDTQEVQK